MALKFKSERVAKEWNDKQLPENLRRMVLDLAVRRETNLGEDTVVTCIWRSTRENKDVGGTSLTHVEWRAVDCRVNPERLQDEMNIRLAMCSQYPINGKMPRIPPLDHGTALHYHVQVTRREAGW